MRLHLLMKLAALERDEWWLVFAIVLSSLLAVAYVWRFVELAYFREPAATHVRTRVPPSMLVPAWMLIAASVYFGLDSSLTLGSAAAAAEWLFRGTP